MFINIIMKNDCNHDNTNKCLHEDIFLPCTSIVLPALVSSMVILIYVNGILACETNSGYATCFRDKGEPTSDHQTGNSGDFVRFPVLSKIFCITLGKPLNLFSPKARIVLVSFSYLLSVLFHWIIKTLWQALSLNMSLRSALSLCRDILLHLPSAMLLCNHTHTENT